MFSQNPFIRRIEKSNLFPSTSLENPQVKATHVGTTNISRLEIDLQHAIEREELKLDYQPCMDLPKLKVVGVEASISWDHPRLGKISATDFLPLAKDTGLITSIDEWVMRTACQQVRQWQNKGLSLSLAVNLSSQTFRQDHFVSLVTTILRQTKLNPKYLELQLTEKAMGKNLEIAMVKMRQLQPLGVKLSNNCGKGCSTLGSLQFLNL